MKTAVLLSGGMDSIALSYLEKPQIAITIDYGQVCSEAEIRAAKKISELLDMEHEIIRVDCRSLGSGDLSGKSPHDISPSVEWWPFRNQLLVTLAGMKALQLGVDKLILGSVKNDEFHVDGTEAFYQKCNELVKMQEGGIKVVAPSINLTSVELIQKSKIEISMLSWSHSCHVSNFACGNCRGCYKQQSTMDELGYGYN